MKIDKKVTISATEMNEHGQLSLKTNLPIFHEQLKKVLKDEENRLQIFRLNVLQNKDSHYDQDEKEISFTWDVEDVTEREVKLKLTFSDPFMLSDDTDFDYHSLSVEVLEPLFFTSTIGDEYEREQIYSRMRKQVPKDDKIY